MTFSKFTGSLAALKILKFSDWNQIAKTHPLLLTHHFLLNITIQVSMRARFFQLPFEQR